MREPHLLTDDRTVEDGRHSPIGTLCKEQPGQPAHPSALRVVLPPNDLEFCCRTVGAATASVARRTHEGNGGAGFENVVLAKVTLDGSGAIDNLRGVGGTTPGGDPVPEPVSLTLLGIGLAGVAMRRRRKTA